MEWECHVYEGGNGVFVHGVRRVCMKMEVSGSGVCRK